MEVAAGERSERKRRCILRARGFPDAGADTVLVLPPIDSLESTAGVCPDPTVTRGRGFGSSRSKGEPDSSDSAATGSDRVSRDFLIDAARAEP